MKKKRCFVASYYYYLEEYKKRLLLIDNKSSLIEGISKEESIYSDHGFIVKVTNYKKPHKFLFVEVSGENVDKYIPVKGMIEVTHLDTFKNEKDMMNYITYSEIILEGTDAVGKSSTVELLLMRFGILARDRETSVITPNMLFSVPMEKRALLYLDYLKKTKELIVFLVNNDEKELLRRVYSRKEILPYDLDAYKYNGLYKNTFEYMRNHNMLDNKLFMVDCTGLDINEQVNEVRKLIKRIDRK